MGITRTEAGKEARAYCEEYPTIPSLQLARMLRRDHPKLFSSIEVARCRIRYYRGSHGQDNRDRRNSDGGIIPRVELPKPAPPKWRRHNLPDGCAKWLILADIHAPYFNRPALEIAVAHGKKRGCDGLLLLGDFLDCYMLSSFDKDPRNRTFDVEFVTAGLILDFLAAELKPKRTVWKYGNHEYRYERWMRQRAVELMDVRAVHPGGQVDKDKREDYVHSLSNYLCLAERGITTVDAKHPIDHHALTLLHGDEWQRGMSASVNPARTVYLKGKECCVVAHSHVTSEHTEQSMRGVTVTCWSVGALCDLHPDYAPLNKWNHGFAILETGSEWRIDNLRIVNGKVM